MEERRFNYANRKKNRCYSREPYRLPHEYWPGLLTDEFTSYKQWRVGAFVPGRPARLRQRPATFAGTIIEFECFFGYLVHVAERNPSSLCLADICDPNALRAYATWHAENRTEGRPSRFIEKTLTDFLVCARHYLKADSEVINAIAALKAEWDPPLVRDERARWNSLTTLEAVGLAEYPDGRRFPNNLYAALAAQRSLIIRLLVRRPLRSRNIREMKLDRNLYRDGDGKWIIEFRGEELKVARRQGRENIYRVTWPEDLIALLEEFLERWRPLLDKDGSSEYVFLNQHGKPLSKNWLNRRIQRAVHEHTGQSTNIHLFRDIWATEFISRTHNFTVAAQMLGDSLETVLRRYMHLQECNTRELADDFTRGILGVKKERK